MRIQSKILSRFALLFLMPFLVSLNCSDNGQSHNYNNGSEKQLPPTPAKKPHVALLGDSNTWNGGDNCDKPIGWNKWFKDAFPTASIRSYARSGATWACTPRTCDNTTEDIAVIGDNNVIYNQVLRLKAAVASGIQATPDIIMISAGTNDVWFTKSRPKALAMTAQAAFSPTETARVRSANQMLTIAQAVRFNCELLREAFPQARIVLITPMPSIKVPEARMEMATTIIEQCAKALNADVIKLTRPGGISRKQEIKARKYTSDGSHTNEAGAKLNGLYIAEQMKLILNNK